MIILKFYSNVPSYDSLLEEISASIDSLSSKIQSLLLIDENCLEHLDGWRGAAKQVANVSLNGLEKLAKILLDAIPLKMLMDFRQSAAVDLFYCLEYRLTVILSQAIGGISAAISHFAVLGPLDRFLSMLKNARSAEGFLIVYCSFLSCFR